MTDYRLNIWGFKSQKGSRIFLSTTESKMALGSSAPYLVYIGYSFSKVKVARK